MGGLALASQIYPYHACLVLVLPKISLCMVLHTFKPYSYFWGVSRRDKTRNVQTTPNINLSF